MACVLRSVEVFCSRFEIHYYWDITSSFGMRIGGGQLFSHSLVGVSFFHTVQCRFRASLFRLVGSLGTPQLFGRRRKSLCAPLRCPPRINDAAQSRTSRGRDERAVSARERALRSRARDARARNSLIAICAAGGPRSAGIGRDPRAWPGPTGAPFSERRYRIHYGVAAAFCV